MSKSGNGRDIFDVEGSVQALRNKGVKLWIENGILRYRARKGLVTEEDLANLRCADDTLLSSLLDQHDADWYSPRILKRPHPTLAPLAFSQLAHWNLRAQAGHRPMRQVASATRIQGTLDAGALKEALSAVISRHEALRTHITIRDGDPVQEITEPGGCDLEVLDVTAFSPHEQGLSVQRQIISAIVDVADYAADPLFRAVAVNLGPNDNVLILALDHMVSDGTSRSILLNELLTVHDHLINSVPITLCAVKMQLADYAIWQRTDLPELLISRMSGWARWPRIKFPEDSTGEDGGGWGSVQFVIDSRTKCALQKWARSRGTSLVMTVLTAFVALMMRWCDTSDVVIQYMVDGRVSPLVENTVGYLSFPLYLRVAGDGCKTFADVLDAVIREYCKGCDRPDYFYCHAQRPLPEVTRNTCFNWMPRHEGVEIPLSIRKAEARVHSQVPFEHPFFKEFEWDAEPSIGFQDTGQEVITEVVFPRKRFSSLIMRRFVANFKVFLDALIATPHSPLQDVDMT